MDTYRAMQLAEERGFDLVEVSPLEQPPVCKIMDYGAYQYQQEKKERKQKAHQKKIEIKGIRLSIKIGPHDLDLRKNQALKFLEKGDKVHIELMLRGREHAHADRAYHMMQKFVEMISAETTINIEQALERQGHVLSMLIGRK